jgi:hypothetical protein
VKYKFKLLLTPVVFFFVSSALYFSPYLLSNFEVVQSAIGPRLRIDYSAQTGLVVVLALIFTAIAAFLYPRSYQDFSIRRRDQWESRALSLMLIVLGLYTALTPEVYLAEKADVLDATNRVHLLFYAVCSIGLIYSFMVGWREEYFNLVLSLAGHGLILYIGHRSALAVALLGIAYVAFRNRSVFQIPLRYILLAIAMLFALAVYKGMYVLIKDGQYGMVLDRLATDSLAASTLVGLEQFLIFMHLDYVVSNNFSAECTNIWLIPIAIIPFTDALIDTAKCTFTDQIRPIFFAEFSGGVGANIWAEFFSYLGYLGLPVLVAVIVLISLGIEALIRRVRSAVLKSGLIIALMHVTFYIQRKELFGAFISAKRVVIAALIIFAFGLIIRALLRAHGRSSGVTLIRS